MELLPRYQKKIVNPVKILCTFTFITAASFIAEHQLIARSSCLVVDAVEVSTAERLSTRVGVVGAIGEDKSSSSSEESSSAECRRFKKDSMAEGQDCQLLHVDFEVHGRVQGVFFRKYTQDEGAKLGLRGFCRNTSAGTVSGGMEGPRPTVDKMKYWLEKTGSPSSRISRTVFTNEKVIEEYTLPQGFDIRRSI